MASTSDSSPRPSPDSDRPATLQLSQLTGQWRQVYAARAALHATADATVLTAWRRDLRAIRVGDLANRFRQAADLGEADPDTDRRRHRATAVVLAALLAQPWTRTRRALRLAVQRARAAGRDAVVLLAGDEDDQDDQDDGEDIDAPDSAPVFDASAGTLLGPILAATARRIARLMAAPGGDQAAAVRDALAAGTDLLTAVDLAVSRAYTSALVGAWQARGAQQLDYVTAGDGRVCPACASAEDGNPWPADAVPQPPLHPNCRCIVQPAT
jgi:hypothetical protein